MVIAVIIIAIFALSNNNKAANTASQTNPNIESNIKSLEDQLNKNPENPQIMMDLGHAYLDGNKGAEAAGLFEKILKTDPGNLDAQVDLIVAKMQQNQNQGLIEELDKILEKDPNYDYALYVKANYLTTVNNDVAGALEILKRLEPLVAADPQKTKTVQEGIKALESGLGKSGSTTPTQ